MAIQQKIYLYEALIRFDENGYKGSHQKHVKKVWDDETGETLVEQEMPAEAIEDAAIVDLVGEQALLMGRQITDLEATLAERDQQITELERQVSSQRDRLAEDAATVAALEAQVAELQAQVKARAA